MSNELHQAQSCVAGGDLEQAERLFRRVLEQHPGNKQTLQGLGAVSIRSGRMEAAVDYLRRALAVDESDAASHNHLGVALASLERFDEGLSALRRAVELAPDLPDGHYNLAKVLRSLDDPEGAVTHYREALRINPGAAEVHYNLANTLRDLERLDGAVAGYREAMRLRPAYLKACNNLGNVLREQGKLHEAAAQLRQAIAWQPNYAEGHHNLGLALAALGQLDDAAACYRRALELRADFGPARNSLGKTLVKLGRLDEAAVVLNAQVGVAADCVDACLQLADQLRQEGRVDEAIAQTRRVLEARSDLATAHNALGLGLMAAGRPAEAAASYRRALEIQPDYAEAHNNLAVALQTLGECDESLRHLETALRIKPRFVIAHLNRAVSWLRLGDFERGWPEFEWRRLSKDHRLPQLATPFWQGAEMPEGTILLHAEQGLGDTIQFIRYAPLVRRRCGRVVVQCQKRLVPLLRRAPGIDQLVHKGDKLPEFDAHAPLMSLPGLLGTTLANVPAEVPYLFADDELVQAWKDRLAEHDVFKVGVAWQGNRKYAGDAYRSLPLGHFRPLAAVPGVRLFNLQRGPGSEQLAELSRALPVGDFGPDVDTERGAFMDTAAIVQHLDLLITSDSAVAHLAGAMGRPIWVALSVASDWRWLEEREDCPWYPSMRLFRQRRLGDWDELFGRIAAELRALMDGDRTRLRPPSGGVSGPIHVPIAPGELLDKVSILEIKCQRITDEAKLGHVRHELHELRTVCDRTITPSAELTALGDELKALNEALWVIEDDIRACEAQGDFGPRFIELARAVYRTNDRRAALKRSINLLLGSALVEEKDYHASS